MNKVKRNLAELSDYLRRDEHGSKLVNVLARDINEQRKRISALELCNSEIGPVLNSLRQEKCDAEKEIASLKEALATEAARRASAKQQEARLMVRIAELENATAVDEEVSNIGGTGDDSETIRHIVRLSKEVRKRFKRIPPPCGGRRIALEDVVKTFSGDEFMSLGMLLAMLALLNVPASVVAENTAVKMPGWNEQYMAHFIKWYSTWISTNATEEKVFNHGIRRNSAARIEKTPFTPPKRCEQQVNS